MNSFEDLGHDGLQILSEFDFKCLGANNVYSRIIYRL